MEYASFKMQETKTEECEQERVQSINTAGLPILLFDKTSKQNQSQQA